MKILMIDDYGHAIGGAEKYMFTITEALRKQGHEVRILSSDDGDYLSDYVFKKVNYTSPFRFIKYMFNASAYNQIRRVVREYKPDIVHLHSFFYHTSPAALYAAKNAAIIITLHSDDIVAPYHTGITKRCRHGEVDYCMHCIGVARTLAENVKRELFYKKAKKNVTYIAPSDYMKQFYKNHTPLQNIIHLKNGFYIKPDTTAMHAERKSLLIVARLSPEKGIDVALRAMAIVQKTRPKLQLRIIGSGPDESRLKAMHKELKLDKSVQFLGKIDNQRIPRYLKNSTALLVPSLWNENLPTVCIEAMACGTPIIASRVGGLPEMVHDNRNGFLFLKDDSRTLAKQIIQLMDSPSDIKRFIRNNLIYANEYTIETHLLKLEEIYTNAIKAKPTKSTAAIETKY